MSAKINIRHMEGVTVLELSGRIVLSDGGVTFRDSVHDALKTGSRKLVVDMLDDLMQIKKLATIFDIYPDELEAVAAFSDYQPAVR